MMSTSARFVKDSGSIPEYGNNFRTSTTKGLPFLTLNLEFRVSGPVAACPFNRRLMLQLRNLKFSQQGAPL